MTKIFTLVDTDWCDIKNRRSKRTLLSDRPLNRSLNPYFCSALNDN